MPYHTAVPLRPVLTATRIGCYENNPNRLSLKIEGGASKFAGFPVVPLYHTKHVAVISLVSKTLQNRLGEKYLEFGPPQL